MCAITVFGWHRGAGAKLAEQMSARIQSHGPDDFGSWCSDPKCLALAYRRLSIVDLSPAGHQPMLSSGDRYTLVFNGEIRSHCDLRNELGNTSHTLTRKAGQ